MPEETPISRLTLAIQALHDIAKLASPAAAHILGTQAQSALDEITAQPTPQPPSNDETKP